MSLELILKIISWAMLATPLIVFLIISGYMIFGAASDDDEIMALVILGFTLFFMGTGMLALLYFTDLLSGLIS